MFSTLRTKFGIPGIISVIALVFAMFGGAYAANNSGGSGSKASASAAGKQGPRGKQGKQGKPGPAGPAGPAGATGPAGAAGAKGATGATGGTGLQGPKGDPGTNGTPGSPWTAGGTLPIGATETGGWSFAKTSETPTTTTTPISFTVPLATELAGANVQSNPVGFPTGATAEAIEHCPGSVTEPKAKSGFLCVYAGIYENYFGAFSTPAINTLAAEAPGASTAGAVLGAVVGTSEFKGRGSWAVTG